MSSPVDMLAGDVFGNAIKEPAHERGEGGEEDGGVFRGNPSTNWSELQVKGKSTMRRLR